MRAALRLAFLMAVGATLAGCPSQRPTYEVNDNPDIPDLDDDDSAADDDDATDDDDASDDDDATDDDDDATDDDDDTTPVDDGPEGWIGGPCETAADCDYDNAVCLTDGYPNGMCSQDCELYCDDRDGYPTTFCVDALDLPDAPALGDGGCSSRCDFEYFPDSGCRPGYGCLIVPRANEPGTLKYACVPGDDTDLSSCHLGLAARGVAFEPTVRPVDHPSGLPDVDCIIDDPVYLKSPVLGMDLEYYDGTPDPDVLVSCPAAAAIADTVVDVAPYDAVVMRHYGTYNCRVIANTTTLSQHGLANAIDIYGFEFDDGTLWTLVDDWDHSAPASFNSDGAEWLYDAAYRWFDADIWNIILTPNYNAAHDDHFHVDLTAGGDYIGYAGNRYFGPAPYAD